MSCRDQSGGETRTFAPWAASNHIGSVVAVMNDLDPRRTTWMILQLAVLLEADS